MFKLMEKRDVFLSITLADGDAQVGEMKTVIQECPDLRIAIGHFGMPTREGWLEQVKLASEVHSIAAAFAPVVRRNLKNRYRATQVAWQLMNYFIEYARGAADIAICIAQGDGEGAKRKTLQLRDAFSGYEIYIEKYYEHWLTFVNFERMKMQEPK